MKYYTGVGSRSTPPHICDLMADIGRKLWAEDYTLRSGGAAGADQAFESKIGLDRERCQIFIPWHGFNGYDVSEAIAWDDVPATTRFAAKQLVQEIHPAFDRLTRAALKMHMRNTLQVLGLDLKTPSKFLICWTPNAGLVGGTRTAIVLAQKAGIPVFNLANESHLARLQKFVS